MPQEATGIYVENTGGDRIDANVDGADTTAIGKNIDQNKAESNVTVPVTVNFPAWTPDRPHGQGEGLSVTDAELLKGEVFALRKDMNNLTLSIGKLDQTLDTTVANQFKLTDKRITALEAIADRLVNQEKADRPTFDQRTSTLIIIGILLIVILLGLQTWSDLSRNALSAQTGAIYAGAISAWFITFRVLWL